MKMKIKQTLLVAIALITFSFSFILINSNSVVSADCGGVETSLINCEQKGCADGSKPGDGGNGLCADGTVPSTEDSGIWGILLLVVNILTAGVGVVAVGGLVYGSIMYTSAGGKPDQVTKAKTIIQSTVIGLGAYALMYSLLNYLIPGGIFN